MADELAVDFFKSARSQLDQTVRWHLVILAALLYLHVGIVRPYVSKQAEKLDVEEQLMEQSALRDAIAPVSQSASLFANGVSSSTDSISEQLLSELVDRFAKLNDVVATLSRTPEGEIGEQTLRNLFSPKPSAQQVQQQAQSQNGVALPLMDASLAMLIARHGSDRDGYAFFGQELETYVEQSVIKPAFDEASEIWKRVFLPRIKEQAQAALKAVEAARAQSASTGDELDEIENAIGKLYGQAQDLRLDPPADSDWWRTVAGKEGSIRSMMQALSNGIEEAAKSQLSLRALQNRISDTLAQGERISKDIAADITKLEEDAKNLQSQLGEFGSPLKAISFELVAIAPFLPTVIAFASGLASLLTAEALRKLRLAVSLSGTPENQAIMQPWLMDIAGGTTMRMTARLSLFSVAMVGWIASAAFAVQSLDPPFLSSSAIAAISLLMYLGCRFWLWRRAASALAPVTGLVR